MGERVALQEGLRLGRYILQCRLGTGGMADVWLARATGVKGFQKNVVLKMILPHLADDPDVLQMFFNEALLAASLDHPNIVHIFDLGQLGETYFIAMEFISGRTLRQVLRAARQEQHLPPQWYVIHVVMSICDALQYAHNKCDELGNPAHVVHRDVTPENIMVSFNGVTKVLDFGIAKAATMATTTRTGMLKGKYAYMAPEQILQRTDTATVDTRSDLYSLGVLLYECLVGVRPFRNRNDIALLTEIVGSNPVHPSEASPSVPKALGDIVLRAMAKNPAERYQRAEELRADLEDFLHATGIHARSQDVAEHMAMLFGNAAVVHALTPAPASPGIGTPPGDGNAVGRPESGIRESAQALQDQNSPPPAAPAARHQSFLDLPRSPSEPPQDAVIPSPVRPPPPLPPMAVRHPEGTPAQSVEMLDTSQVSLLVLDDSDLKSIPEDPVPGAPPAPLTRTRNGTRRTVPGKPPSSVATVRHRTSAKVITSAGKAPFSDRPEGAESSAPPAPGDNAEKHATLPFPPVGPGQQQESAAKSDVPSAEPMSAAWLDLEWPLEPPQAPNLGSDLASASPELALPRLPSTSVELPAPAILPAPAVSGSELLKPSALLPEASVEQPPSSADLPQPSVDLLKLSHDADLKAPAVEAVPKAPVLPSPVVQIEDKAQKETLPKGPAIDSASRNPDLPSKLFAPQRSASETRLGGMWDSLVARAKVVDTQSDLGSEDKKSVWDAFVMPTDLPLEERKSVWDEVLQSSRAARARTRTETGESTEPASSKTNPGEAQRSKTNPGEAQRAAPSEAQEDERTPHSKPLPTEGPKGRVSWDAAVRRARSTKDEPAPPTPVPPGKRGAPVKPPEPKDTREKPAVGFGRGKAEERPPTPSEPAKGLRKKTSDPSPSAEPDKSEPVPPSLVVERKAAKKFEEGMACMKARDYSGALSAWEEALALDPNNRVYRGNIRTLKKLMQKGESN